MLLHARDGCDGPSSRITKRRFLQRRAIRFGSRDCFPRFLKIGSSLRHGDVARGLTCDEIGDPRVGVLEISLERELRVRLVADLPAQVVYDDVFRLDLAPQLLNPRLAHAKVGRRGFPLHLESADVGL
jgi:hypothetical protein